MLFYDMDIDREKMDIVLVFLFAVPNTMLMSHVGLLVHSFDIEMI